MYIQWNIMQPSKNENFAICNDLDGTRGCYAKGNEPIRERHLSYYLTDMWNLRNKIENHKGREEKNKTR